MQTLNTIINYLAFAIILTGFTSILLSKFKIRDIAFLVGTSLLTLGAIIGWMIDTRFEIMAFVLLFALQVIASVLQITSGNDKLNTRILLLISILLFIVFFLAGLFDNNYFFLIALGTAITGIGYKEKPQHVLRQSILFITGIVFEIAFALVTSQMFYFVLNAVSFIFVLLIFIRTIQGKIDTGVDEV